jgi:hypothetical protein
MSECVLRPMLARLERCPLACQPHDFANLAFELKLPPAAADISKMRGVLTRVAIKRVELV